MPHLFADRDDFVPGGVGGLDDGDRVRLPWVRDDITDDQFAAAPLRGWHTVDLYCRGPREVREVAGELVTRGNGFYFAVRPVEVFRDRPDEQTCFEDRDRLPRLA